MQWNVLGTGAIGCLVASQLRLQQHRVNLILRSRQHLKEFEARKNTITYESQGKKTHIGGFTASVLGDESRHKIENLVVATKAHHTAAALASVVKQIGPDSTVLLLQNGVGIAEELESAYWLEENVRPRLLVGVNRHAVERVAQFQIIHHSGWNDPEGGLMMGEYFTNRVSTDQQRPLAMEQAFASIPTMQGVTLSWNKLYIHMLKKLVVNASINPVAALLDTRNGSLTDDNVYSLKLIRRLCQESIDILGDDLPGETATSLSDMVIATCHHVAGNSCSMLQDVKAKRRTEIDYINGFLCKLAKSRGVEAPTNMALVDLIHAKERLYL